MEAKGELGWSTELGEAWSEDGMVWNGIEIGISSRGEVVSGSSRSVDAMGRRNSDDSCSRGTCEDSAETEGAAAMVLAETATSVANCSVDTLVVVGGRTSDEGWGAMAADVLGDDGDGMRVTGVLGGGGDENVTALDKPGDEGLGSSNTSVDCGNSNTPRLLKTVGGTAELTSEVTTLLGVL